MSGVGQGKDRTGLRHSGIADRDKGLPLAYNKDFQEDKEALFDAFPQPVIVLRRWRFCLRGP